MIEKETITYYVKDKDGNFVESHDADATSYNMPYGCYLMEKQKGKTTYKRVDVRLDHEYKVTFALRAFKEFFSKKLLKHQEMRPGIQLSEEDLKNKTTYLALKSLEKKSENKKSRSL